MQLDFEAMSVDLVRALRGGRSQTAFARRLGYRSNVVYTWESGRRWPDASTFLRAAGRVGIDVPAAIRAFYRSEPPWLALHDPATPDGVAALLSDLRGATPVGEVATRAERSRFAVSRWLKGGAEPRLPELLRMIEATSLRSVDFVAQFADASRLPSTRRAWQRQEAARDLAWRSPWTQAVLLGLDLAGYRALEEHDDAWLGDRLGLPAEAVTTALVALADAGQARWDGRRWTPVEVPTLDARRRGSGTDLKEHWSRVALERLAAGRPGTFSYNLFTVSEADLARIEELQRAHYRAVRAIVADSAPSERIVLLNLQLVPLDADATGPSRRPGT